MAEGGERRFKQEKFLRGKFIYKSHLHLDRSPIIANVEISLIAIFINFWVYSFGNFIFKFQFPHGNTKIFQHFFSVPEAQNESGGCTA